MTTPSAADLDAIYAYVSGFGGERAASRRHIVRRPTADACHRPGVDGAPETHSAGRTFNGTGAAARRADIRASSPIFGAAALRCFWSNRMRNAALAIADRGYVLETGRITITGARRRAVERSDASAPPISAFDRAQRVLVARVSRRSFSCATRLGHQAREQHIELIIDVLIEIGEFAHFAGMQSNGVTKHQDIERRHARIELRNSPLSMPCRTMRSKNDTTSATVPSTFERGSSGRNATSR